MRLTSYYTSESMVLLRDRVLLESDWWWEPIFGEHDGIYDYCVVGFNFLGPNGPERVSTIEEWEEFKARQPSEAGQEG